MERKRQEDRQYEEFEPSTGWAREPEYDTFVVNLPGFKKEHLKVQVTSLRNLRISGERPLGNNKWRKFRMEFPIPSNYDTNEITAKFEGGSLYIKHPKIITKEDPKPKQEIEQPKSEEKKATTQNVPSKPKNKEEARMQKADSKLKSLEEKPSAQRVPPTTSIEKQPMVKANGVTNSADDSSQKEAKTKSLEKKKKSDDLGGEDDKMDENLGQPPTVRERIKSGVEGLNKVVSSHLATEKKQPRKSLINFVVAVLLILVVGIYARNAIRSIGKPNN